MTTRSEFEKLAEFNLADAELLLERERFTSAYQLAGFAAECALKAIVVRQFKAEKLPNLFLVEKAYTHDLEQLMELAGLEDSLSKRKSDKGFARRWAIVKNWNEEGRYTIISAEEARDYVEALSGDDGVMAWIRGHW